ncbi:MAG: tetratricopeptide repeat protein [Candidatus Sulfotelmatobacter sp.]
MINTKVRLGLFFSPKIGFPVRFPGRGPLLCGVTVLAGALCLLGQDSQFEKSFQQGAQASRGGHWEEAADDFAKAVALNPASAAAYFNLGLARLQQGRVDEALVALNRAVTQAPKLRGANLFLGIARYRKNDFAGAAEALKREVRLDPRNAQALMWLGVVQLGAGNADAASVVLDEAAKLAPGDVDILYHRGRAHMLVSKESYEQMFKADPQSWRVHQALAQSFVDADRLEDAAKECEIALNARPHEPGLHEELADIYWKENQLEKAESAFQDELKVDPESISSMYKLAVVSLQRSKPEVAVSLLTEVLHRAPQHADAHYQMGRAEAQLAQVDEAIKNFRDAVADSAPSSDGETVRQSYYQLAQLYRRAGRAEDSKAALESFMKLKQEADAAQVQKLEDKMKRAPEAQEATR